MTDMNSLAGATDSTGQCGKNVGKSFISYPCRLSKGHPAEEPCVAPEVPPSIRAHDRWEASKNAPKPVQAEPAPEPQRAPTSQSEPEPLSEVVLDDAGLGSEPIIGRPITTYAEALEVTDELRAALYRMRGVSGATAKMATELHEMLREVIEAQNKALWDVAKGRRE